MFAPYSKTPPFSPPIPSTSYAPPPSAATIATEGEQTSIASHDPPDSSITGPKAQIPFDIPELFVKILQHIEPLELVLATRINKTARDLIRDSSAKRWAPSLSRITTSAFHSTDFGAPEA